MSKSFSSSSELITHGNRLLRLHSFYSLFLALMLLMVTVFDHNHIIVGSINPELMLSSSALYVILAALFAVVANRFPDPQITTGYIFVEIAILTTMMSASGGFDSGFPSLIAIPVIISNLLTPSVLGYGVAAWTTLAIIYSQLALNQNIDTQTAVNAGIFGFLCFVLAWVAQSLSKRLKNSLSINSEQAIHIRRLQKISQQALLELPQGIIACDRDNVILFFNQQMKQWFNLVEGNSLPTPLISSKSQRIIHHNSNKLIVSKVLLKNSKHGDYILSIEDSARLTAEAQQIKLASLGRLTASIAHEIRNPLSALRHASQLLEETPYLEEGERALTHIIDTQCLRINRIIEDVLQLSKPKKANINKILLSTWLQEFSHQFNTHYAADNVFQLSYQCEPEVIVYFDIGHLQQVMHNLCANALRHAIKNSGDHAKIHIAVKQASAEKVQMDILDNGGGIDSSEQAQLFEPFYTNVHDGTGLGLYICRELCEANFANIEYHAIKNGSCFRVMLKNNL